MAEALLTSDLGSLSLVARGKVRDIYALGDDLLFVATDRISAVDVCPNAAVAANHLLAIEPSEMANLLVAFSASIFGERLSARAILSHPTFQRQIAGRSMIVRRARMFPVECVVRGYLSGSGRKDYRATGSVCGISLPAGLRESERLPEPIFTPAAKIDTGG